MRIVYAWLLRNVNLSWKNFCGRLTKKKEKEIKRKERAQIPEVTQNPHLVIELFHKQTNNTNSSTSRRNQINQSTKLNNRNFNFLTQNIKKNQNFNNHMKKIKDKKY